MHDNRQQIEEITEKLLETGWQSWSLGTKQKLPFLQRNYAPKKDSTMVDVCSYNSKDKITGWCSWYAYRGKINEEKILEQARFLKQRKDIPLKYILIDDGWTEWGDWHLINKEKFPRGLDVVCKELNQLGFKTGLWVAPFLVSTKSEMYRDKKDWLVRDSNGKLVEGFKLINPRIDHLLPYKKFILNIKNEEVQHYLEKSIDQIIVKNKISLLKLDYLYAPYFDPALTAEEASQFLKMFLKGLKARHPHVHLIGSGLPLIPAAGNIDSMRVGPDSVMPHIDRLPLISRIVNSKKIRMSIKALRNRGWTSSLWTIDPDVFVCRKSLQISKKLLLELQNEIIQADGNIFLGDDLTRLPEKRIETFVAPLFKKAK